MAQPSLQSQVVRWRQRLQTTSSPSAQCSESPPWFPYQDLQPARFLDALPAPPVPLCPLWPSLSGPFWEKAAKRAGRPIEGDAQATESESAFLEGEAPASVQPPELGSLSSVEERLGDRSISVRVSESTAVKRAARGATEVDWGRQLGLGWGKVRRWTDSRLHYVRLQDKGQRKEAWDKVRGAVESQLLQNVERASIEFRPIAQWLQNEAASIVPTLVQSLDKPFSTTQALAVFRPQVLPLQSALMDLRERALEALPLDTLHASLDQLVRPPLLAFASTSLQPLLSQGTEVLVKSSQFVSGTSESGTCSSSSVGASVAGALAMPAALPQVRIVSATGEVIVDRRPCIVSRPSKQALRHARQIAARSRVGWSGFIRPVDNVWDVSSEFGPRWGRLHKGVDLAAPIGEPVLASDAGQVTYVGYEPSGYGKIIEITHRDGWRTLYAHAADMFVQEGQQVHRGQCIAAVGATGTTTGPHLHWEIRNTAGEAVNPSTYVEL